MKKRTLYITVSLIFLSLAIGPMGTLENECCLDFSNHLDSMSIVYPDGRVIYVRNISDGADEEKWLIEILIPEDLHIEGYEILPIAVKLKTSELPQLMGVYPQEESGTAGYDVQNPFAKLIIILLFGLAGLIFADTGKAVFKKVELNRTAA